MRTCAPDYKVISVKIPGQMESGFVNEKYLGC
jgi:hypothetical protein